MLESKTYVIKNNDTDKWINIDNASGGYPYDVDIHKAKIFYDKESALKYLKVMNKNWSLFRLDMFVFPVNWEDNEVEVLCINCKYDKAETYHDKMWCRDCQEKNRFKAKEI